MKFTFLFSLTSYLQQIALNIMKEYLINRKIGINLPTYILTFVICCIILKISEKSISTSFLLIDSVTLHKL